MSRLVFVILALVLTWGCASIVSKSTYPVTFDSEPPGAKVLIADKSGRRVFEGQTPTTVTLSASRGFFQPAVYEVQIVKDGYAVGTATLRADWDGWYFGNIIFGGLIGLLIVDPATGAMWKLDERVVVSLVPKTSLLPEGSERTLRIVTIDQIPVEYHPHLTRVN